MRVILLRFVYPLQYPVVRFVQSIRQFVQILAEVWGDAMLQRLQLAEYPSEPVQQCENMRPAWDGMMFSHSIGSFRQCLDHQILIVRPPSPHRRAWGRVYRTTNILSDVRLLSAFVV